MPEIYQGVFEDVIAEHDLKGRTVRIEVIEPAVNRFDWLQRLKAWQQEFQFHGPPANDSRESIYSGTIDDPR